MNRVFVDMDGVIVDFDKFRRERGLSGDEVKAMPGAYQQMQAIKGAIDAVRSLIGMGYEVWLATKPPTGIAYAYSDKAAWVYEHLPELKRRLIITHDKGLLGDDGDFLCDDRPHKANCEKFKGTLLRFVDGFHWPQALDMLRRSSRKEASGAFKVRNFEVPTIDAMTMPLDQALALADHASPSPMEAQRALQTLRTRIVKLQGILCAMPQTATPRMLQHRAQSSGDPAAMEAERWRTVRGMDGCAIYHLFGALDGMHPEHADKIVDTFSEKLTSLSSALEFKKLP